MRKKKEEKQIASSGSKTDILTMKNNNGPLKKITLQVVMPKGGCLADLSRKFPDVVFKIVNGHDFSLEERIVFVAANPWKKEYTDFLIKHPEVISAEVIGNVMRLHFSSSLLKRISQKHITIIHPTTLQNGIHTLSFLMTYRHFERLKKEFSSLKIVSITDSYSLEPTLTDHQEAVLWQAYSLGYYHYPRKITLTQLARLLHVSKATLSQTLRTIEAKAVRLLLEKQE